MSFSLKKDVISLNVFTNKIDYIDDPVISRHLPFELQSLIMMVKDDDYIFGVGYPKGDLQIGITGHGKKNETTVQTIDRELQEELNMCIKSHKHVNTINKDVGLLFDRHVFNIKSQFSTWDSTILNIKDVKLLGNECGFMTSSKKDLKYKRVGVVVYGSLDDLYEVLETNYNSYTITDNITKIVIFRAGFVKKKIYSMGLHRHWGNGVWTGRN
jgi:hypothetical protein